MSAYYSEALERQIDTHFALKELYDRYPHSFNGSTPVNMKERDQWLTDLHALKMAKPFYWSKRTTEIVSQLSHDFDLEHIDCTRELMYCDVGWMWFPEQSPLEVELFVGDVQHHHRLACGLKAISWYVFGINNVPYLGITGWSEKSYDANAKRWTGTLTPSIWSSTFLGEKMASEIPKELLDFTGVVDDTTEHEVLRLKQFVVAAQTFIRQEFLSLSPAVIDRAARKRLGKKGVVKYPEVNVVYLRKAGLRKKDDDADATTTPRDWSCQWTVRGHVRRQWYASMQKHLPVYVHPYLKGPEDKPLKARSTPIFAVTR